MGWRDAGDCRHRLQRLCGARIRAHRRSARSRCARPRICVTSKSRAIERWPLAAMLEPQITVGTRRLMQAMKEFASNGPRPHPCNVRHSGPVSLPRPHSAPRFLYFSRPAFSGVTIRLFPRNFFRLSVARPGRKRPATPAAKTATSVPPLIIARRPHARPIPADCCIRAFRRNSRKTKARPGCGWNCCDWGRRRG